MTSHYLTVPTQHIQAANGVTYAYRELGERQGIPIVLFTHLAATLDNWDYEIVDRLAASHWVIAFDNRGVGSSTGDVPKSIKAMAADALSFIQAMQLSTINVLSFSLGGFIAQELALNCPGLINRLILAGTGTRGRAASVRNEVITHWDTLHGVLTRNDPKLFLFFPHTQEGLKAGRQFIERINARKVDRDLPISVSAYLNQLTAIRRWHKEPLFDLSRIDIPVLIVNGDDDRMVPTDDSYYMAHHLPNTELVIYPDAGHGGIFQNYEAFADKALEFFTTNE